MDWRCTLFSAMLLSAVAPVSGQTISLAYCGQEGKAHIGYQNGTARVVEPERQQVGCEDISTADDKRTVAWSVLFKNCNTSYPVPLEIVVFKNAKKRVISPGQMVWKWHFIGNGDRIAVLSGPTHGWAREANVYDSRNGKVLISWDGRGDAPDWAEAWEDEFQHDESQQ